MTRSGRAARGARAPVAVARGHHPEAVLLEVQPHELDDVPLVVDDEDGLHGERGYAAPYGVPECFVRRL